MNEKLRHFRPWMATMWIQMVLLATMVEAANALTWNFTYEVTGSGTIRNGSWTDQAPENPLNDNYPISSVRFNTGQPEQNFNTEDGAFLTINDGVSYVDGEIEQWSGTIFDTTFTNTFRFDLAADMAVIEDAFEATVVEEGQNFVFTRASAGGVGADYDLNVVPACLLIGLVFAIKKLRAWLRDHKASGEARESEGTLSGASDSGKDEISFPPNV